MKKILFILLAALAIGCESRNQATYEGAGSELEERAPVDPADTTSIDGDTTASGGINQQSQQDTLQ